MRDPGNEVAGSYVSISNAVHLDHVKSRRKEHNKYSYVFSLKTISIYSSIMECFYIYNNTTWAFLNINEETFFFKLKV